MFQYTQQPKSSNRFTNRFTNRVPYIQYQQYTLQKQPPQITFADIQNNTDIYHILRISHKYNIFIEQNEQVLLLSDTIEFYLDIRDALLLRIYQLKRCEHIRKCLY